MEPGEPSRLVELLDVLRCRGPVKDRVLSHGVLSAAVAARRQVELLREHGKGFEIRWLEHGGEVGAWGWRAARRRMRNERSGGHGGEELKEDLGEERNRKGETAKLRACKGLGGTEGE